MGTDVPGKAPGIWHDSRFAAWRETALKHGFQSSIALPLIIKQSIDMVLSICAVEPEVFDDQEVSLLRQLAENVSYGISVLRTRDANRQAEERAREKDQRLQKAQQIAGLGFIEANLGPHTSKPHPEHKIYPYLLRGMKLQAPNLVWSTDLTYIPMAVGFMYLTAVIDWYSRYVLSWELSNTMDYLPCRDALQSALLHGEPVIFNTDQGSQFTSKEFTQVLLDRQILISMDGRGRALDNVFIERLWRSVKYENIYLNDYQSVPELYQGLSDYFSYYNQERPHQSLGGATPAEVHYG